MTDLLRSLAWTTGHTSKSLPHNHTAATAVEEIALSKKEEMGRQGVCFEGLAGLSWGIVGFCVIFAGFS